MIKRLYEARDEMEAAYLHDLLISAGIDCQLQGGSLAGAWGDGGLTEHMQPSLWVEAEDFDQAMGIIDAQTHRSSQLSDWHCPECGQKIEGQFTDCWHCGRSRPMTRGSG